MVNSRESSWGYPPVNLNGARKELMSEFEKTKLNIAQQIRGLCAHCANGVQHRCKVDFLARQVSQISGVPLIVNDRFNGLLLTR